MIASDPGAFVTELLHRVLGRTGLAQVFLFGAEGDPFWAARKPVRTTELAVLREALDLIERAESSHAKPFVAKDDNGRFTVAAIDSQEDLYVVLFADEPTQLEAEAEVVARVRELVTPHVNQIRGTPGVMTTASGGFGIKGE